jgi:hypothetical protein
LRNPLSSHRDCLGVTMVSDPFGAQSLISDQLGLMRTISLEMDAPPASTLNYAK